MELSTPRIEVPRAPQLSFLHRSKPKIRDPEKGPMFSFSVIAPMFNWSPASLCHVTLSMGEMRPLTSSPPSGRLVVWPNQRSLHWTRYPGVQVRRSRFRSCGVSIQSLSLQCRIQCMLSLSETASILSYVARTCDVSQS